MPNYIGNTGETDENQFMVQNRAAIDTHLEQLSSVKDFTNLWNYNFNDKISDIKVSDRIKFEIAMKDENADLINVHLFINYIENL